MLIKTCLNEIYNKVGVGKYLSDNFPIESGLKQGDALPPQIFSFTLESAIGKVQENQVGLKLNGTQLLLVCADDVNVLSDNIDTIKRNTESVIHASKEVGLEVNTEKTKYMLLSHHQNAGQNHDVKIADRSFETVAHFKYLGTTVVNQNLVQEEIRWRLNSDNACYRSVQKLLSSRLLSKNIRIIIYRTIIFPAVLCGCDIEEHRLRVFENRVLRRIFGSKRDEVMRD
jgi:hypothetical protein